MDKPEEFIKATNLKKQFDGVDILHGSIHGQHMFPILMNFFILTGFCILLFYFSLRNIHRKWIL